MSDENQRDINQQKKKRRTRKDQEGRNFTCPCGKSYLSYPALYTHIKTKHHGKMPKQLGAGNVLSKIQHSQQNETADSLFQIKQIIQKYFQNQSSAEYSNLLSPQCDAFINEMVQQYETGKDVKSQDASSAKNQTIAFAFGKFVSQIKQKLKTQAYVYLCDLIFMFSQSITQQKKDVEFIKNATSAQIPYFFNEMIAKKRVPAVESKPNSTTNSQTLACKFLYSFGTWLFQQKLTNLSIKFNTM